MFLLWLSTFCCLTNNGNLFLTFLEDGSPALKHGQTWCPVRACLTLMWWEEGILFPLGFFKCSNPTHRGSPWWPNYLPRSHFQTPSHWVGAFQFSAFEFWEGGGDTSVQSRAGYFSGDECCVLCFISTVVSLITKYIRCRLWGVACVMISGKLKVLVFMYHSVEQPLRGCE